ncbi:transmembrane protein 268-like [Strongylocentrotus purpuratus]|uniref:TIR domain-containing protein n=1 Tax=Strongylocentrotus purpuratus TaxID=7668 RepID=A0A7M7SUD2_STRPU|nr:transmembrane protein 268-like [Strongylocentrotus purpuratus]
MDSIIPSEFPEGIFVEDEKLLEGEDTHMSSFLTDWDTEADQGGGRMVTADSGDDHSVDSLPMSPDEANSNQNADMLVRGMAPVLVGEETSHAFFCFAWEDDEWAINVIRKLESSAYGFSCDNSNHKWDPGVAKMDKIINSISTAKKLVLVVTPDFMRSPWCMYENLRALRGHYTNTAKVIVVVLGEIELPDFLEGIPTINAMSRNFWQRFVAALRLGSSLDAHDASLNNNVPALYNSAHLATIQSSTDCCCKARFDTIYCPDELARKGVQIPQQDYTAAISSILDAPKMRWYTLWYNRLFSSLVCAIITALIIVGVVGNLSNFHNKESGGLHVGISLLIAFVLSAVVVGLLHLIVFYEKRKLNGLIEANLSRANMIFCKHNILVGMTDRFNWCWNRAVLHFIYFDLTDCRKEMIQFLSDNRVRGDGDMGLNQNSSVSVEMLPSSGGDGDDTTRLTIDTRLRTLSPQTLIADTDPRSIAEEAELYLMQHSAPYINKLLKKQLVGPLRKRHCRTTVCLCQFTQKTVFCAPV